MRKVLILILLSFTILSVFSTPIDDVPTSDSDFNFTVIPYYGGVGVNLGSLYYPQHNAQRLTWQSWDGKSVNAPTYDTGEDAGKVIFLPTEGSGSASYSAFYSDYHIIVLGGGYNLPFSRDASEYIEVSSSVNSVLYRALGLSSPNYIRIPREEISLNVDAVCSSDFEFVSQSNPLYRRPFKIEVIPRVAIGGTQNDQTTTRRIETLDPTNNTVTITIPSDAENIENSNWLSMLAADMVLVLPYDYANYATGGGYFSGGLTYNNATYPLADLDDYTAVVTITLTLSFNYYFQGDSTPHKYTDVRTITIPFSGYYASNGDGNVRDDDSISMYVNPTNEAANLDLARQEEWITVGNIQFLYNDRNIISQSQLVRFEQSNNPDIVRIFLSASPYPDVQSTSEFRMVHENATNVVTNTNSLGFTARITGTGANSGDISISSPGMNYVDFDGLAYTGNIKGGNNPEITRVKDVVKTVCNTAVISNNFDKGARHFHTFEGEVQIMFDESDMLQAGIYRGYVYVHAVTEDE